MFFSWSFPGFTFRVLEVCSPPFDETPPEPGSVTVKWLPWGVLHVAWSGFKENESRILQYAYCIGLSPTGCELQSMRDVGRSLTATVTGVAGTTGSPMFVVVRCTNTQQLETSVTVRTSFAAGASSFQQLGFRSTITDEFVDLLDSSVYHYTNATENDYLVQLSPVQDGVNVTALEWAFVNFTTQVDHETWRPVGRFDQLKAKPSEPFQLTIDLSEDGMVQGQVQFLLFRARNSLNEDAQVQIQMVLDRVRPTPGHANAADVSTTGWVLSRTQMQACWAFVFPVAPLDQYYVQLRALQTGPLTRRDPTSGEVSFTLATTRSSCVTLLPQPQLKDGHRYIIRVEARSSSGMTNYVESFPVPVDASPAQCMAGFTANEAPVLAPLFVINLDENPNSSEKQTPDSVPVHFVPNASSLRFQYGCEDPHSGLVGVQYAIVTRDASETSSDAYTTILPRQDGQFGATRFELRNASVYPSDAVSGQFPIHVNLYGVVIAHNGAGAQAVGVAGAVLIDPTPPALNGSNFAVVDGVSVPSFDTSVLVFQSDATQLRVVYDGAFTDAESGITHFEVSYRDLGLHPKGKTTYVRPSDDEVLAEWNSTSPSTHNVGLRTEYNITSLTLVDGHVYVVTVVAFNGAGLRTAAVTGAVLVDNSPPPQHGAWVDDRYIDGNCGEDGTTACHVYQASEGGLRVWWAQDFDKSSSLWNPSSLVDDPDSGLLHLELAVLRMSHPSDEPSDGSLVSSIQHVSDPARRAVWLYLPSGVLRHSSHYRVRVTTVNNAFGQTHAYSNVVTIDTTAPVVHNVTDAFAGKSGVLDASTAVAADAATGAWQVFVQSVAGYDIQIEAGDRESPLYWHVWSLGTSPGDNDVQLDTGVCAGDVDGGACGDFPECLPEAVGCSLEGPQVVPVEAGTVADFVGMLLFAKVRVYNQASLSTTFVTPGRMVDEDDPTIVAVLDGWKQDAQFVSVDEGKVFVSWIGVEDQTTAVVRRSYAVTTTPEPPGPDVFTAVSDAVGSRASFNYTLTHGKRYYVHLRVADKSGRTAQATSSGALVDFCPPIVDWVRFVTKDLDLRFQNTTDSACCFLLWFLLFFVW